MEEYTVVGKRAPLIDASEKVTGQAIFTGDIFLPGMLHAKILRSPYAHARVLRVNTSRAEKLPGVKSVLSKNNAPRKRVPVIFDAPPTKVAFDEKVRFVGDEVAAVAAVSEKIAEEALSLIKVDYEELPAIFNPEEAMNLESPLIHADKERNIASSLQIKTGDTELGFKEADYLLEETFRTASQRHACMETHRAIASFDSSGKLTVWTPTQLMFLLQGVLAEYLDMPLSKIRVIKPYSGGGFGSKLDMVVEHICALLSKMTGYPVKLALTREEEFSSSVSRHAYTVRLKIGARGDGTLTAIEATAISNEGAYLYKTGPLGVAAKTLTATYKCPNTKFEAFRVFTNTMPAGAYRGYGNPQAAFALESMIDMIAEKVGIDPVEFRLRNYRQEGEIGVAGLPIATCGINKCLNEGRKLISWDSRRKQTDSLNMKELGKGVACSTHATGTGGYQPDYSTALLRINEDGSAQLFIGVSDIGTGSNTTLAQIAAEELNLNLDEIGVVTGDTETAAFDKGAFASKTLYNAGNAVRAAAIVVKQKMLSRAAKKLNVNQEALVWRGTKIYVKDVPEKGITIKELAREAGKGLGGNETFVGEATFVNTQFPPSFNATFAEVEVDTTSGQVEVKRIFALQDSGTAINPQVVEGQIEGAIQHMVGYALTEKPILDKFNGKMINPDFANYMVLTALDMPEVKVNLVETMEPSGPFGAKGVGELPTVGVAPAIVNAIYDAVGVRLTEIPTTSEDVFQAIKKRVKPNPA